MKKSFSRGETSSQALDTRRISCYDREFASDTRVRASQHETIPYSCRPAGKGACLCCRRCRSSVSVILPKTTPPVFVPRLIARAPVPDWQRPRAASRAQAERAMYTLIRLISLRHLLLEQVPALGGSLLIAVLSILQVYLEVYSLSRNLVRSRRCNNLP